MRLPHYHFLFFVLSVLVIKRTCCKSSKKKDQNIVTFLEDSLNELQSNGLKCSLKKVTTQAVNNLRWTKLKADDVVACSIKLLLDNKNDGYLWSILGSQFSLKGQDSSANYCFKQALKLTGKVTSFIKQWYYLGPFVIGKSEFDGDPIEAFGGIYNISKYRESKNQKFYSEFLPGGGVSWQKYHQRQPKDSIKVQPNINWNELVSSLSSMGITEWQGWLIGEFAVNSDHLNVAIQCLGHHTVYIDKIPVTGDVYHRKQFYFGVSLKRGLHTIYVKLRAKIAANLMCDFQVKSTPLQILAPHFLPDLIDGHIFGSHIALPVTNNHNSKWVKVSNVKVVDQSHDYEISFALVDQVEIAPGQTTPVNLEFESTSVLPCQNLNIQLKLTTSEGNQKFSVSLRCRKLHESFLFTFLDHDGSIQHAAAIYPLQDCSNEVCPVVLTLHGTTVPPQNQADSYKYMVGGKFVFGVSGAWLLAPTRHGAHNWEGPGILTSMQALDTLSKMTKNKLWLAMKADNKRVVFAGHSMGGHGALNLATHYPDRALALISLAAWIKKEDYGDSNLFFRHDIATSHVDPRVKLIMESSVTENDVDRHINNLKHVSVLLRTGSIDRTVPPFYLRRIYRLLKEIGAMVNYTEPEGKEHWWWDTKDTNDGGVVNDQYIRDFTEKAIKQNLGSCINHQCEDVSSQENKYTKPSEFSFSYTCINPAFGEGLHGFKVIQQLTPLRLSLIEGKAVDHAIEIKTTNVLRFNYMNKQFQSIQIDSSFSLELERKTSETTLHFCRINDMWEICSGNLEKSRGPDTYGPARRIAENRFFIVTGTNGDEESSAYIQQFAVYIANLFFLTSDTQAIIVKDDELDDSLAGNSNLILIGLPSQNSKTARYLQGIPFSIQETTLSLSGCKFGRSRTGLLTLTPNGKNKLALILMANSFDGLYDVVSLATPTIPPMTRSPFSNLLPDYVVTGPEYGLKGPGGFLCTGFYGNNWEYRSDISSCVC